MITEKHITKYKTYKKALEEKLQDPYKDSEFLIFKNMSSKKKGSFFEKIFEEYVIENGGIVEKPSNSDHDRIINGIKVEIKGSTLWGSGSHFRFQQIRANQDYDMIIFVSVFPDKIEFHYADKDTITKNLMIRDNDGNWPNNQHGGKGTNSGTFFIDCFPNETDWMTKLKGIEYFETNTRK
tara:strand:+ start:228 stop:770 length:543 start_codon:yes stop_codon:yes gene_type:complete